MGRPSGEYGSKPIKTLIRRSIRSRRVYNLLRRTYLLWIKASRRPHETDFAFFRRLTTRRCGIFVDVGANGGQSAVSFSCFNKDFDIIAFEPNHVLEPELKFVRKILGPRFSYHLFGLGEEEGELDLHVPFVGLLPIDARASLNESNLTQFMDSVPSVYGRAGEVQKSRVMIRVFDELSIEPDIIKIDVEGLECSVLRGMKKTIEKCRPVFLIEKTNSFQECREFLSLFGYRFFVYDAAAGNLIEATDEHRAINFFALPPSTLDDLPADAVAAATGKAAVPPVFVFREVFDTLWEAQVLVERWRREHNRGRPNNTQ